LALIVDVIDIIDLTGIGIIIGRIISFAVSAVIILIFWFTNTKQKRADEYVENIQKKIEDIRAMIANAERNILRVAKLSRKVPGAKKLYRKFHLKTIRRARVAIKRVAKSAKSPIARFAMAGALNLVPLLALVPWMLVGIWLSYRAEKESYKNAREEADSVIEAAEETETT
jgi:cytochrome c-type biogenesis protein CcmH/NrfG